MITSEERNIIIENLGKHYTDPIQRYLSSIQLVNKKGNNYSKQSIRNIVSGSRSNKKMERAIIELVTFIKRVKKVENEDRIKLFENQ